MTDPWRETVRDLYDECHFGTDSIFTGSQLAQRIVEMIERRHPDFFCVALQEAENEY